MCPVIIDLKELINTAGNHEITVQAKGEIIKPSPNTEKIYYNLAPESYLTFKSDSSFTIKASSGCSWNGKIEYSLDKDTWTVWNRTTSISSGPSNILYMRGTDNTRITHSGSSGGFQFSGHDIDCFGNIENLLDYKTVEKGEHPVMNNHCFYRLFKDCLSLRTAPDLCATTLTEGCYQWMFVGCSNLITANVLSATEMNGTYCCYEMFYKCKQLKNIPSDLFPLYVSDYSYYRMFEECEQIRETPKIHANYLDVGACQNMFKSCIGLTSISRLPFTLVSKDSCREMFRGCESLRQIPALYATTLEEGCYFGMFQECEELILNYNSYGDYRIPYKNEGKFSSYSAEETAMNYMFWKDNYDGVMSPNINTRYSTGATIIE